MKNFTWKRGVRNLAVMAVVLLLLIRFTPHDRMVHLSVDPDEVSVGSVVCEFSEDGIAEQFATAVDFRSGTIEVTVRGRRNGSTQMTVYAVPVGGGERTELGSYSVRVDLLNRVTTE